MWNMTLVWVIFLWPTSPRWSLSLPLASSFTSLCSLLFHQQPCSENPGAYFPRSIQALKMCTVIGCLLHSIPINKYQFDFRFSPHGYLEHNFLLFNNGSSCRLLQILTSHSSDPSLLHSHWAPTDHKLRGSAQQQWKETKCRNSKSVRFTNHGDSLTIAPNFVLISPQMCRSRSPLRVTGILSPVTLIPCQNKNKTLLNQIWAANRCGTPPGDSHCKTCSTYMHYMRDIYSLHTFREVETSS